MKKIIILFLILLMIDSCSFKKKPDGILSEDMMVNLLVDIHMAEGYVQSLSIPYDSSRKLYPVFEKEVFEKHQVPDSVYVQSLQYYLRDAAKMEELYSRTIDSLILKEKRAEQ